MMWGSQSNHEMSGCSRNCARHDRSSCTRSSRNLVTSETHARTVATLGVWIVCGNLMWIVVWACNQTAPASLCFPSFSVSEQRLLNFSRNSKQDNPCHAPNHRQSLHRKRYYQLHFLWLSSALQFVHVDFRHHTWVTSIIEIAQHGCVPQA